MSQLSVSYVKQNCSTRYLATGAAFVKEYTHNHSHSKITATWWVRGEAVLGHSNQTSASYLGDEVVHAQSQRKGQISNDSDSHFAGRQVVY